ncbi:hypothetical protein [Sphingobacterium anhuiense]|uniref:Uncharacterized protein n=1 Tax=Sphingobacterium anhuiense TaxID=493780 RepID=A0ABW5YZ95_9SPHI
MKKTILGVGAMAFFLGSIFMANANQNYSVKADTKDISVISLPLTSNLYNDDDDDNDVPETRSTSTADVTTKVRMTTGSKSLANL